MARRKRLKPEVRREMILLTALEMARKGHYLDITRKRVADVLGITPPLVSRYFSTQNQLQEAVYKEATHREIVEVVAQRIPPGWALSGRLQKKLKKYLVKSLTQ